MNTLKRKYMIVPARNLSLGGQYQADIFTTSFMFFLSSLFGKAALTLIRLFVRSPISLDARSSLDARMHVCSRMR